jgi:hypothetical protein
MRQGWQVAVSAAVLLTTASAGAAAASETLREGVYALASAASGRCLDVEAADTSAGAAVGMWECLDLPHQTWALRPLPEGGVQLVAQHSGKCLSAMREGGRLRQHPCRAGADDAGQAWLLRQRENGRLALSPRGDATCLRSPGGELAKDMPTASATCRGDAAEEWQLLPLSLPATRVFPARLPVTVPLPSDIEASPLQYQGDGSVIAATTNGTIVAHDPLTGAQRWSVHLPRPEGRAANLWATPVIVGHRLVAAYDSVVNDEWLRLQHVAVVDLDTHRTDNAFPMLTLSAELPASDDGGTVRFRPDTQIAHATLVHLPAPGGEGRIYVGYGGRGDTQPWHGWLFEIDLAAWRRSPNSAVSSVLVTTPEASCPVEGRSGATETICGGGIWSPAGPLVVPGAGGPELIVATGNGRLDLGRRSYAQTLMRVQPGLAFDPDCAPQLCEAFNPMQPDEACMRSCRNLFIPRLLADDRPLRPASGECDGMGLFACMAIHDFDLGAGSPARVELRGGPTVLVQPGKEGAVYLIDAGNLGTLYDREQVVPVCGTETEPCGMDWAGMMVTQPVVTTIEGQPMVLVATYVPDQTHYAGLVALAIEQQDGKPRFRFLWRAPEPGSRSSTRRFRYWPSRVAIGKDQAWLIDYRPGEHGTLVGVRLSDGIVTAEMPLLGQGARHTLPLVNGDLIYLASTAIDGSGAWLEAYRISSAHEKAAVLGSTQ